jgi:hypothetical protein
LYTLTWPAKSAWHLGGSRFSIPRWLKKVRSSVRLPSEITTCWMVPLRRCMARDVQVRTSARTVTCSPGVSPAIGVSSPRST